jgi:peptide/nickel transport system permease protein
MLTLAALSAPLVSPHDPARQDLSASLRGPSLSHPLGQDKLGRDILSRLLFGARISLWVAVLTVSISLSVGVGLGLLAGYFGGLADMLLMRLVDVLQSFPGILLAIAFAAVLGPSLTNVVVALSLIGWVGYARLTRGQVLSLREEEYVLAAQASGASHWRVMLKHLLPNILGPIIVQASFQMAAAIIAESSLSFLGLGTQPPTPSWGGMLNDARPYLLTAPNLSTFPGLAIMVAVLAFNFLGDGFRDIMDPAKKGRPS